MGLFSWFQNQHRNLDDCYGMSRSVVDDGILESIQQQRRMGNLVLLVAHFPNTFERMVDCIDQKAVDITVCDHPIDHNFVSQKISLADPGAFVTLAPMLKTSDAKMESAIANPKGRSLCVIVCERHPLYSRDLAIGRFVKGLNVPTKLGYMISLEDPLLKPLINDWTKTLLVQMGFQPEEMMHTQIIRNRLVKLQKRYDRSVKNEVAANSAEEWFQKNKVMPQD